MKRAFTLIELLLYVSLAAFLLLSISTLLMLVLRAKIKNQAIAEVYHQGNMVMSHIAQSARSARQIQLPATSTVGTTLTLAAFEPSSDPTVYDISSDVIRFTKGAATPLPLTSSRVVAHGLAFQNLSRSGTSGTVRIEFTLTHVNPEGRNEYEFSK